MTKQQKKMKKYCSGVERRLNLPRDVKARVMNDFTSSIAARREAGEEDAAIFAELGTPKEAAALLNEQMKEYAYRKSPWRWAAMAVAVLSGGVLLWTELVNRLMNMIYTMSMGENQSLGVIGGADGPTVIFLTTAVRTGLDWDTVFFVLMLAAGLAGWWYFSHMRK